MQAPRSKPSLKAAGPGRPTARAPKRLNELEKFLDELLRLFEKCGMTGLELRHRSIPQLPDAGHAREQGYDLVFSAPREPHANFERLAMCLISASGLANPAHASCNIGAIS